DSFHLEHAPPFVEQLLSEESLRRTGYFRPDAVRYWRQAFRAMRPSSKQRISGEMGLVGVLATQLWHQLFLGPGPADLPAHALALRALPGDALRRAPAVPANGRPHGPARALTPSRP